MRLSNNNITWQPLIVDKRPAAGSFNIIYVSAEECSILDAENHQLYHGRLALKVPKPQSASVPAAAIPNNPRRAVRVFCEINPEIPALEYKCAAEGGREVYGWVLPYFDHAAAASDEECAGEVLRVYRQTGRIGTDFASPRNVLKVIGPSQTSFVCVDVDAVLLLKPDDTVQPQRRGSDASCYYYKTLGGHELSNYLNEIKCSHPRTAEFIRTLLCLDRTGPTVEQRGYLTREVMERLSYFYRQKMNFYDKNPQVLLHLVYYLKESIALRTLIEKKSLQPLTQEAAAVLAAVKEVVPDNLQDLPKLTTIVTETRTVLENPTPEGCRQYNALAQNAHLSKKWGRLVGGAMLILGGALLCTFGGLLICSGAGLIPFTLGVSGVMGIVAGGAAILAGLAIITCGYKTLLSGQKANHPQKAMHRFFTAANSIATKNSEPDPRPHSDLVTVNL